MKRILMRRLAVVLTTTLALSAVPVGSADAWTGRCATYEPLMVKYAPRGGWDVRRMSYYAYRESRCTPTIVNRTGGDTGLFQIHPVSWPWLASKLGVPRWYMGTWLKNPSNNTRAAAALCTFWRTYGRGCYQPWAT